MDFINIIILCSLIFVEVLQQIFFKLSGLKKDKNKKYFYLFLGVLMYLLFMFVWFRLLKNIPLGIALPALGLNYVFVAFCGQLMFKEKIDLKRWCGIFLIFVGFILVGIGGADFL
ncbi:MAG: SMR family transporter [Candidatus Gastranaerophilaceae bacterium]